jgi:UDP:flavonoid glycosyltransferase YjiC (YdhE family)
VPFFGDQPFWARRIAELGAGPPPLDRKTLSPDRLAAAIVAMDAEPTRERARRLGDLIGREDGAADAVRFIEERLQRRAAGGERA